MSSQSKRTIWILLVCQFLICLGMSLIFPVMPFIKKEYNLSAFEMGLMSSLLPWFNSSAPQSSGASLTKSVVSH